MGSATAYMLLKDGARVIMAARSEERLREIRKVLSKYGNVDYVVGDASGQSGARKIVEEARKKAGRIDHLALLAGNYVDSPIENLTEEQLDGMINANLKSPIYALNAAVKDLGQMILGSNGLIGLRHLRHQHWQCRLFVNEGGGREGRGGPRVRALRQGHTGQCGGAKGHGPRLRA